MESGFEKAENRVEDLLPQVTSAAPLDREVQSWGFALHGFPLCSCQPGVEDARAVARLGRGFGNLFSERTGRSPRKWSRLPAVFRSRQDGRYSRRCVQWIAEADRRIHDRRGGHSKGARPHLIRTGVKDAFEDAMGEQAMTVRRYAHEIRGEMVEIQAIRGAVSSGFLIHARPWA